MVLVHVVWSTWRRHPLLARAIDDRLIGIIGAKARDIGCVLLGAGCALDHVHALVRLVPSVPLADLVQRIKGGSAYDINHGVFEPRIRWQPGCWAESLSPADVDPLARYVRNQRGHHDFSHPAERWQFDHSAPT